MKEHGLIEIVGDDGVLEIGTVQCVHCAMHFPVRPGSGIERGFCTRCNGYICGRQCAECKPVERWLDEMEGTKRPDQVSVNVPKLWMGDCNG